MNITGEIKVWIKKFNGVKSYSTAVSNKNKEGQYEKMYIALQLPKKNNLQNGETIEIKKSFMSMYKDKNGLAHPKIVIQEYITTESNQEYMYEGNELPL